MYGNEEKVPEVSALQEQVTDNVMDDTAETVEAVESTAETSDSIPEGLGGMDPDAKGEAKPSPYEVAIQLFTIGAICSINGILALYNGKAWVVDEDGIYLGIHARVSRWTMAKVKGIIAEASKLANSPKDHPFVKVLEDDPHLIAFNNGVLDIRTMELLHPSPRLACMFPLEWDWTPEAKSEILEKFLNDIACGDDGIRQALINCMATCLYRPTTFQIFWLLVGGGANGKSGFFQLETKALSRRNVSTLSIKQLSENRFATSGLVNKLANINSDNRGGKISEEGQAILKSIATGDGISTEKKGQDICNYNSSSPMMEFGCNNVPTISDRTNGMSRRMLFIPMRADFSRDSKDCDPFFNEKLISQETVEAFLVLAVQALKELLVTGIVPECELMKQEKAKYLLECDQVKRFCIALPEMVAEKWVEFHPGDEVPTKPEQILTALPFQTIFELFRLWAKEEGEILDKNKNCFSRSVQRIYDLETTTAYFNKKKARTFRPKAQA